jgi:fibronectin type 3 domain-containing protein
MKTVSVCSGPPTDSERRSRRRKEAERHRLQRFCGPALLLSVLLTWAVSWRALAGGTWAALTHPPPAGLNNALLLSDGSVICGDGGSGWYRLTPDIHGSYVNGTWTVLASTHYTRLFYSSDVLTNGNVYVAGGEYGTGKDHAELYDPLNNTWTEIPKPASDPAYSDAVSKILPGGKVLQGTTGTGVWLYNPSLNTITAAAAARNQNEACWVKLPNDNVLTIDAFGTQSEHYVPSLNAWYNDGTVPVSLYGHSGELGAGFVLPNGNVFYIGGTTHTAIYTPGSTVTAAGTWVAGPEMVFGATGLGAVDAPAAMMANGNILCSLGPTNGFNAPTYFYEYDYVANAFTQVNGPTGTTLNTAPFATTMLDLADGSVLFISGQGSTQLYIYLPAGSPLPAGQPVINNITENTDGSFHLAGTGLNGISSGAAYGDDWQMDSNYPLVRMTNTLTGNIYYARTYGWNSTSVMTGNRIVTTEFSLPATLPPATYSLVVVANGNPSAPLTFDYSPPAAPAGLSATIGNSQLGLSWNAVPGATAYNLKRSNTSGAYYETVATLPGTNYTDTGLINATTYYYVVNAVGSGGPSAYSAQLAVAPFGPPPAPTGLSAGPDSYLGVSLSWNASSGAATYNVKRSTSSGGPYTNVTNRPNPDYDDTDVLDATAYYYVVSAVSAGGESADSAQAAAIASAAGDVTNGLAGNWRFDDGTGTTATDSSGNNNTGTLLNGPAWVAPGRIGPAALSFIASNQQSVTVANSASLNMSAGITITAWINAADWSGNRRIVQKGNSDNQYRFLAENNVFKFHLNGVSTVTSALPPSNVWIHVAGTWNGSTMLIYTNGEPQATLAAGGAIATTLDPLAIAKKNTGTSVGDFFNGQIDEVRIYNRALGQAEINTVMHAGDSVPATPTGLSAAAGNALATVSWTRGSAASSYNVKRSTASGGPYSTIGSSFATTYTDAGVTNGTTYYYVVSAVNFTNESANSSQVSARPGIGVTFFVDINYSGAAGQILGAGNYTLAQLQAAGIPNDSASSCRIPNGWTVIVYQNDNYGGTSWTLTSDTPNFTAYSGLNDNMSSCKIIAGSPPSTPAGLGAAAGDTRVALSWNASSGASVYNLKRSTTNGGPYALLATTTATNYTDTGLADGTAYYYVVAAANTFGESPDSASVSATPAPPPAAPAGLNATAGYWQVSLLWNPSDGATGYNLKRSTASGGPYTNLAVLTVTNYTDTGLLSGTTYYYVVSATNNLGESPNSSEAGATPFAPPIVLTAGPPTNGQFTLQFQGVDGHNYIVQMSTNLMDWVPVFTNQTTGGLFLYTDTNATDPARFYRIQQ